jgi:ribose/xylose/arabinose/galactoside ABC-type transport system permease subunit
MNLAEVNGYVQDIVLGLVILAALHLDRFRKGR